MARACIGFCGPHETSPARVHQSRLRINESMVGVAAGVRSRSDPLDPSVASVGLFERKIKKFSPRENVAKSEAFERGALRTFHQIASELHGSGGVVLKQERFRIFDIPCCMPSLGRLTLLQCHLRPQGERRNVAQLSLSLLAMCCSGRSKYA